MKLALAAGVSVFLGGLGAIFQILLAIFTARFLSVDDRGLYSLVFSNAALFSALCSLGVSQAVVFFVNRERINIGIVAATAAAIFVIQVFISAVFWWVISAELRGVVVGSDINSMHLVFVLMVLTLVSDGVVTSVLLAQHRFAIASIYPFIQNLANLATAIPVIFDRSLILEIMWLRVAFNVAFNFAVWLIVFRITEMRLLLVRFNVAKGMVLFGIKSYVLSLLSMLNQRYQIFFLGAVSSLVDVGLFSIGLVIVSCVRLVPDAISSVLYPKLASHSGDRLLLNVLTITKVVFLIGALVCFILGLAVNLFVVDIFGADYNEVLSFAWILIGGSLVGVVYQVLNIAFTSMGEQRLSIYANALGFLVLVLTTSLFYAEWRLIGVAFSYLLSSLCVAAVMVCFLRHKGKFSLISLLMLRLRDIKVVLSL
jgi:O-antigen/teichoic acid export membrane protein